MRWRTDRQDEELALQSRSKDKTTTAVPSPRSRPSHVEEPSLGWAAGSRNQGVDPNCRFDAHSCDHQSRAEQSRVENDRSECRMLAEGSLWWGPYE